MNIQTESTPNPSSLKFLPGKIVMEKEGLSLGTSTGINVAGAIKLAKDLGPKHTIVTILCDKSDIYRSKMFNKKFLTEKGLPCPKWL